MTTIIWILLLAVFIYGYTKHRNNRNPNGSQRPFLSLFGDTFKLPPSFESKAEAIQQTVEIEGCGTFDGEVVGESNYTVKIWACIPENHEKTQDFRLYFVANLLQYDDNKFDKNAVAVRIRNSVVGHLSRETAVFYRAWASQNSIKNPASCRCVIVKKPNKPYSIWLDLPFPPQ